MSMLTLGMSDLASILDASGAVDAVMPHDGDVPALLEALAALVGCDLLFWTRFGVEPPGQIAEIGLPHRPRNAPTQEWLEHRHEHPICSGNHGPVVALSDVLTQAELHRSWLYQECLRHSGWEHEIGLNLSHLPGEIHDIVISRGPGSDFSERDRLVLRLLHPHLDAALRRVAFPLPRLTDRERQVMQLVREGLTNREAARILRVAESTVVKHLEHIYARIGAHSRSQAIRLCESAMT